MPYFLRTSRGAALVEYVVLMALIAVIVIFSIITLGRQIDTSFTEISQIVEDPTAPRYPYGLPYDIDDPLTYISYNSFGHAVWNPGGAPGVVGGGDGSASSGGIDIGVRYWRCTPPGFTNYNWNGTTGTYEAPGMVTTNGGLGGTENPNAIRVVGEGTVVDNLVIANASWPQLVYTGPTPWVINNFVAYDFAYIIPPSSISPPDSGCTLW